MRLRNIVRFVPAAALMAAVVFSAPVHAQRLSLAERVAKLWADPLYRLAYDPDGRRLKQRRTGRF